MDAIADFFEQYSTEIAIVVAVLVVLLLVWLVARAMRNRGRERTVERPTGTVRRPVYTDRELLEDLLATARGQRTRETTDDGEGDGLPGHHAPATAEVRAVDDTTTTADTGRDRDTAPAGQESDTAPAGQESDAALAGQQSDTASAGQRSDAADGRADDTRRVAETLEALQGTDVLIDLDADPDAELVTGKAVVMTGTLERHPASDAAEILELSAPLLHRGAGTGEGHGSVTNGGAEGATAEGAPLVVRLEHPIDGRDYLMVLPRDNLAVEDPTRLGGRVSVLAVVERALGKRDTVDVEDYLRPHLSREGQQVLRDRDLGETIATLSQVASEDLGADDLPFRGPGALLTPAAIQR